MVENVNTIPEFINKEDGIFYSAWVIGGYWGNKIGPFRIIRAYKDSKGKVGWESAEGQGEYEDLFEIPSPDFWCSFNNDINAPT